MAENDFISGTQSEKVPYAIIVMLLGIFSIIACFFGGWPGLLVAGIGLFLASKGSSAYKASPDTYMASSYSNLKLGRILCWVGFIISALVLIIGIMVMSAIGEE